MAVKLRLRRMGKKKQPIYKIVAADARSPRDGRFLEMLGLYNPLTNPHTVDVKEDRVIYWLNNGAQPTHTVKSLLRQKGITLKNELTKRGVAEDRIESELADWNKLKEASRSRKTQKKKISRKTKAKVEASDDSAKAETVSQDNSEKQNEAEAEKSTAEVKGAASDEKESKKE